MSRCSLPWLLPTYTQVGEVLRGVRAHFTRFVDALADKELKAAQLGLAHSYSRAKVKFNVNKVDNMIIQVCGASRLAFCSSGGGVLRVPPHF
jgi:hypothetical protein